MATRFIFSRRGNNLSQLLKNHYNSISISKQPAGQTVTLASSNLIGEVPTCPKFIRYINPPSRLLPSSIPFATMRLLTAIPATAIAFAALVVAEGASDVLDLKGEIGRAHV